MGSIYSFWQLLRESRVDIPIIQRDYAQGRIGKEKLRTNFLNSLKSALIDSAPIQLDFIYGAVENKSIIPLDGQQRLTTLWLLHWYIAYKSGELGPSGNDTGNPLNDNVGTLLNFSYETRDSSRDFCRKLASFTLAVPDGLTIVEHIENQNWFCSYWKQDPTIQSMLRMLSGTKDKDGKKLDDGLEQIFDGCQFNEMWKKLVSKDCPITFYYLDLAGLKQTDDLYIKMNARGEPLSDFENFKADLSEYLADKKEEDQRYDEMLDIEAGFPIKMDRDWANIFWNGNCCDEAFMAFLNRFFLAKVILQKKDDSFINSVSAFEDNGNNMFFDYFYGRSPINYVGDPCIDDSRIAYSDFSFFKYNEGELPYDDLLSLKKTLDGYLRFRTNTNRKDINDLTSSSWGENFSYIPEYDGTVSIPNFKNEEIHKIKSISQNGRVLFYAVCRFMEQVTDQVKEETLETQFKQWMRVVWNLISDVRMRSIPDMVNQLRKVETLSDYALDIYNYLAKYATKTDDNDEKSILNAHLKEEQIKAGKITEDSEWEKRFIKYESKNLSKGTIRYLFTGEDGSMDNWADFDTKARNMQWDGALDQNNECLKDLVKHCSSWAELKAIIYDSQQPTWIINLTNKSLSKVVHNFLMQNETSFDDNNESHKLVFRDLTETKLLSKLLYGETHISGCKLRDDKYGLIALFPDRAVSEQKKYVMGNNRNQVLAELINNENYTCDQGVKETDLFWGWDLYFKDPDGQSFRWTVKWDNGNWKPQIEAVTDKNTVIADPSLELKQKVEALRKRFFDTP